MNLYSQRLKKLAMLLLLGFSIFATAVNVQGENDIIPNLSGKLVYHTYSSYEARDSKLYLYDFDSQEKICLNDKFPNVYNVMNANFSNDGSQIVFMGMDKELKYEKWDIYTYDLVHGVLKNLTKDNELRNEDPKFSPDGKKVIFKQGHWDTAEDDMIYDLKELDLENSSIKTITNDLDEDSMPFYEADGNSIYYVRGRRKNAKIYKVDRNDSTNIKKVYSSNDVMSYYPIVHNNNLYFAKWYSKYNQCDIIMRMNVKTGDLEKLKSNNKNYNCSDPCPISDRYMIMSSTKGDSGYDLYLVDNESGCTWSLSQISPDINDENEQLGASCFIRSIE